MKCKTYAPERVWGKTWAKRKAGHLTFLVAKPGPALLPAQSTRIELQLLSGTSGAEPATACRRHLRTVRRLLDCREFIPLTLRLDCKVPSAHDLDIRVPMFLSDSEELLLVQVACPEAGGP
jgi:hypothetical protein